MGCKEFLKIASLLVLILFLPKASAQPAPVQNSWILKMSQQMTELEKKFPGQIGVYVKRLQDNTEYSLRGEEFWYVASGVKLPIALEVFRQIDQKKFTLDTRLTLKKEDYIDGAGDTNFQKPGSRLTIRYLLEQMLIHSDNTASDLLIKKVGIEPINTYIKELIPAGFEQITTLADVRRRTYGEVHPSAESLSGSDFLLLKSIKDEDERFQKLCNILNLKKEELKCPDLGQAYQNYYAKNLNSATLKAYGDLLEQLVSGKLLSRKSQRLLIKILTQTETGQDRIVAGLPAGFQYAHKTGTQRQRICDFGIAWQDPALEKKKGIIIIACVRNSPTIKEAETILKQVGENLVKAGVFL